MFSWNKLYYKEICGEIKVPRDPSSNYHITNLPGVQATHDLQVHLHAYLQ